jgi:16S rRNA (cytosine1402-N4)-methyltransferase
MNQTSAGRDFDHAPVMASEIVALLGVTPPGVVLDATLGGGGHAALVLSAHPHLRLVGIDQDPSAVEAASSYLARFGDRALIRRARFDELDAVLDDAGVGRLSGALFDLGVSSPQLDRPERGFSYRADGPLDMRMDPDGQRRAEDVINGWSEAELARAIAANGEARFARRIARAIIAARPVSGTVQLAEVVRDAIPAPARRHGGHPARRVFQAVRIAVNDETDILGDAIDAAVARLSAGGRIAVLSYHSGEDRIVKQRLRAGVTGACVCPPGLPCVCGATPTLRLLTKGAQRPSADEVERNRRSESARLRAAQRLAIEQRS